MCACHIASWLGLGSTSHVLPQRHAHISSQSLTLPRDARAVFFWFFFSGLRAVSSDHARMRVIGMFDVCGARALMCVCVCVCVCVTMKG